MTPPKNIKCICSFACRKRISLYSYVFHSTAFSHNISMCPLPHETHLVILGWPQTFYPCLRQPCAPFLFPAVLGSSFEDIGRHSASKSSINSCNTANIGMFHFAVVSVQRLDAKVFGAWMLHRKRQEESRGVTQPHRPLNKKTRSYHVP